MTEETYGEVWEREQRYGMPIRVRLKRIWNRKRGRADMKLRVCHIYLGIALLCGAALALNLIVAGPDIFTVAYSILVIFGVMAAIVYR